MTVEVIVCPHDSAWLDKFAAESQLIMAALRENVITVHHIGSTAIPRILAKPVIDILVVVTNINLVSMQSVGMENLGYETMGEFGIPGRRYFRKDDDLGTRTHHVHVFEQGNSHIERHLAFRDFLIFHPDWAAQYSELKRDLAAKHPNSMDSYIKGKHGFIQQVDQLAAAWKSDVTTRRLTIPRSVLGPSS